MYSHEKKKEISFNTKLLAAFFQIKIWLLEKEKWKKTPKMRDKQKPKDPLAYRKQIRRNVFATWSGETKLVRQAERRGKLVRRATEWGNPFFDEVGNASVDGGGKNVEGERGKGKGCAWSGPKRTKSKSVVAEALAQISAWFTPVHAERENANSPTDAEARRARTRRWRASAFS